MSDPSLTEFLRARLAEDEEKWRGIQEGNYTTHDPACDYPGDFPGWCNCNLVARLLLEVEAKRRIVETLVLPYIAERRRLMNGQPSWGDEHPDLLLLLALPYADHDDYDERWRP